MTVVDYGMGNLLSVTRAFERCGASVKVSDDPGAIGSAERLVLPGVGAFADGMNELRARGLAEAIVQHARGGRPLLGICLGMHMLMDESEEFGRHEGLGLVPGRTVALRPGESGGRRHKVPNIGWSEIHPADGKSWAGTLLEDVEAGEAVYFVHSFAAEPQEPETRLALAPHDGTTFTAALARENVVGTQFHPEKSGAVGLRIVAGFLGRT